MNTNLKTCTAAAALLLAGAGAQAAAVALSGSISAHNDVVHITFTLGASADVAIWTDSWLSGLNFDPTAVVWAAQSSDHSLLAAVDDDNTVAPGQGFYDTGFVLPALAAGNYRLTLAAAINSPQGTLLSQGFAYDAEAPITLALWNQPTYDPNLNDQKGGAWRVNFTGVDAAVLAVPAPGAAALAGLALGLMVLTQRRAAPMPRLRLGQGR